MIKFHISGGKPLKGEVVVRGAKNAGFKLLIASLMADGKSKLSNITKAAETKISESVIKNLGGKIDYIGGHTIEIDPSGLKSWVIPYGIGKESRASTMFVPSLLYRFGEAKVPWPGGDKIGARPLDRHFEGLEKMGVVIKLEGEWVTFKINKKLAGCQYRFAKNTHTGTETLILAASFAKGETVLENAAQEPEVDDLIEFLNKAGAKIKRTNPRTIVINGVTKFKPTEHQIIPDRNEAVTFACAALGTKGHISIFNIRPKDLTAFTDKLAEIGAEVKIGVNEMEVKYKDGLKATTIETTPHPGFMTDWQSLWFTLMTQARGKSTIIERVYPSRFQYVDYLIKMGAKVKFFNPEVTNPNHYYNFNLDTDKPEYFHGADILGPINLKGICAEVNDIRAGATLTLAALIAEGESVISGAEKIERGYENLDVRLANLGGSIKRIRENKNDKKRSPIL
jgi:UDP-N-acetylglucosamine 1-carboxyvinyltransferase